MFHKLASAWQSVARFFNAFTLGRAKAGEEIPKLKLGLGGWLSAGFRTVGALTFVASPLLLLTPFLFGTSWIAAVIGMATIQWSAVQFLDFYQGWIAGTAWLKTLLGVLVQKKSLKEVMA